MENLIGILGIPALIGGVFGLILLGIILSFVPVRLWVAALAAGVKVSLATLIGMRLRKVPPRLIVEPQINATKAGLSLDIGELEAHYLAGGNVNRVVHALISADKAGIGLEFQQAAAIDLAGRDVDEAVQVSVNPKVIQTPKVAAMAKDGIQMIAIARVTVRANIQRLVGGFTHERSLAYWSRKKSGRVWQTRYCRFQHMNSETGRGAWRTPRKHTGSPTTGR